MAEGSSSKAQRSVLWSRLLTHSGDQAWDFAVPLTLAAIFPTSLRAVALYFLCVKAAQVAWLPHLGRWMDGVSRRFTVAVGIGAQTLAVGTTLLIVSLLSKGEGKESETLLLYAALVGAGIVASLGSSLMDIAVSQDLVPELVHANDRTRVNARLRQIDLGTELSAPVLAGLLLSQFDAPEQGLAAVALWNVASFIPEYLLLRVVLNSVPTLLDKPRVERSVSKNLFETIASGWKEYFRQPVALSMLSYSCLWLTVLSPHGALLTAWLRSEWQLSETSIGLFRGLGAVFGLTATLLFPRLVKRFGLIPSARALIAWEAIALVVACLAFATGQSGALPFLAAILLSRVGLYGFMLGETEIRQSSISAEKRGQINGVAAAINSLATLLLYAIASLFASPSEFGRLVYGSATAVCVGAALFAYWSATSRSEG